MSYYAVDFGTTNSLLSYISSKDGSITPIPLENKAGFVLKTLMFTPNKNVWHFGNEAISEYVSQDGEGRFFKSIKKFLPEPNYNGTMLYNKTVNISELIAVFLFEMRQRANKFLQLNIDQIVIGRPALYSLEKQDDLMAEERMRSACEIAGFKKIHFCPEPVAAGFSDLNVEEDEKIVLVADFGGGTSDFTLMKIHKNNTYSSENILGLSGIFKAGDALDGILMQDFIAQHFGSKIEYKIPGGNNILKFPKHLIKKICSPAHINDLKDRETWEFLQHIRKFVLSDLDNINMGHLNSLVEYQLGFPIFNEIEKIKINLSEFENDAFCFQSHGINIKQNISRVEFEKSVMPTIEQIINTMMEVFTQSNLKTTSVDQVYLTGGTSQFPLIIKNLETIFGKNKIFKKNIYQSIVNGLAEYTKKVILKY